MKIKLLLLSMQITVVNCVGSQLQGKPVWTRGLALLRFHSFLQRISLQDYYLLPFHSCSLSDCLLYGWKVLHSEMLVFCFFFLFKLSETYVYVCCRWASVSFNMLCRCHARKGYSILLFWALTVLCGREQFYWSFLQSDIKDVPMDTCCCSYRENQGCTGDVSAGTELELPADSSYSKPGKLPYSQGTHAV